MAGTTRASTKRPRRWLRRATVLVVAALGLAVVGYASFGLLVGSQDLIRPDRSRDCRTPAFAYGWPYEAINYDQASDAELRPYRDPSSADRWLCDAQGAPAGADVVSADGTRLAGWYIPAGDGAEPTARTLILVHGRSSNKSEYLRYAVPLHASFNVVLADLRDAGQSQRADETMGVREAADVVAFIDWLATAKHPSWIGLVGTSLGAASGLGAAASDERIRAVVLDSTHSRIAGTIGRGIEQDRHVPAWPAQALSFFGAWIKTGVDLSAADPIDVIPRLGERPLLLIHGSLDTYDPPLDSVRLNYGVAVRTGVPVEIHVCAGAGHDEVIDACPADWASWVSTFLLHASGG